MLLAETSSTTSPAPRRTILRRLRLSARTRASGRRWWQAPRSDGGRAPDQDHDVHCHCPFPRCSTWSRHRHGETRPHTRRPPRFPVGPERLADMDHDGIDVRR